ncbi:hypothetical protein [Nannocystis sp.]|uniref:hypothetical protein n=1 Tax=Nannocystis sp. TaxID=1962667 RepID=UPI0025E769FF|nr:hypothetical protein [Nannocystis sp.]MBK7829353.1 hypothetical protein [Nannocystis sp.]
MSLVRRSRPGALGGVAAKVPRRGAGDRADAGLGDPSGPAAADLVPLLTGFIELVVFLPPAAQPRSLITLVTAAFLHCARTLFTAARELSFDAGPEGRSTPRRCWRSC